jgi:hypothetical protein
VAQNALLLALRLNMTMPVAHSSIHGHGPLLLAAVSPRCSNASRCDQLLSSSSNCQNKTREEMLRALAAFTSLVRVPEP